MRIQSGSREDVSSGIDAGNEVRPGPAPAPAPAPTPEEPGVDIVVRYEPETLAKESGGRTLVPPPKNEDLPFNLLGGLIGMPGVADLMKSLLALLSGQGKMPEVVGHVDAGASGSPSGDYTPPMSAETIELPPSWNGASLVGNPEEVERDESLNEDEDPDAGTVTGG